MFEGRSALPDDRRELAHPSAGQRGDEVCRILGRMPSDDDVNAKEAPAPVTAIEPRKAETAKASPDIVVLGPPTADGAGVHVLRAREHRLETGELRTIEEGRPITGEVVTLAPRKDNPRVCDVKDSYTPPGLAASSAAAALAGGKKKGPAQVATQQYRDNWEEVFARRPRGELN